MKNEIIAFLTAYALRMVLAAALAALIAGVVDQVGHDIPWWAALVIALAWMG